MLSIKQDAHGDEEFGCEFYPVGGEKICCDFIQYKPLVDLVVCIILKRRFSSSDFAS